MGGGGRPSLFEKISLEKKWEILLVDQLQKIFSVRMPFSDAIKYSSQAARDAFSNRWALALMRWAAPFFGHTFIFHLVTFKACIGLFVFK